MIESLQQRTALEGTLFSHVRAEGAAIIANAPNQSAGEVVAALAAFIRRYERGLPSLLVAEGASSLSTLEKMLITVLSLLPAAALRLWEAVGDGSGAMEQLHADVVTVLRYVQEKDDFERQLATALAYRLAGSSSRNPSWARSRDEAADLVSLVERLQAAFGRSLTARVTVMLNDCLRSARKECASSTSGMEVDDEEELDDLLIVDDEGDGAARLQVLLCSQASWPRDFLSPSSSPKVWSDVCPMSLDCALPADVQKCWAEFCAGQRRTDPHKRATFLANQGWAEVELDGKPLWVTTAMMVAIGLLAEEEEPVTFDALCQTSRLPARLLRPTLLALCHAQVVATNARLPRHEPVVQAAELRRCISPSHHFTIAWERLAAAPAVVEEVISVDEVDEDVVALEDEECLAAARRKMLDACIVGILREEEAVEVAALKQKVIGALKQAFIPQPATIHDRIDALVEERLLCYDPPGSRYVSLRPSQSLADECQASSHSQPCGRCMPTLPPTVVDLPERSERNRATGKCTV